jgi:hypothetical protein
MNRTLVDEDRPLPPSRRCALRVAITVGALAASLLGCAASPSSVSRSDRSKPGAVAPVGSPSVETRYGIQVEGLRLTAAGAMLDFRYRVVDPQRAAPILDGRVKPYLLDEAHASKLGVPDTPVLGRIRQTSRNNKILTDRTYFIMFGNPGKAVQSGDKVTLLLGEVKITDLTVQ